MIVLIFLSTLNPDVLVVQAVPLAPVQCSGKDIDFIHPRVQYYFRILREPKIYCVELRFFDLLKSMLGLKIQAVNCKKYTLMVTLK